MTRIGLISDTHGYLDPKVVEYFADVDEIWHSGDFGNADLMKNLSAFKPMRGVWGNIDGKEIREEFPEIASFTVDGVSTLMIHIGGYPGRYAPKAKEALRLYKPKLFISGHSHILKVIYDPKFQCLHMNPGAAGKEGWHQVRTLLRFCLHEGQIQQCEVIELGKRSTSK